MSVSEWEQIIIYCEVRRRGLLRGERGWRVKVLFLIEKKKIKQKKKKENHWKKVFAKMSGGAKKLGLFLANCCSGKSGLKARCLGVRRV